MRADRKVLALILLVAARSPFKPLLFLCAFLCAAPAFADAIAEARAAQESGDFARSLKLMLPLVAQGNAKAQSLLGNAYATGAGVMKDDKQALHWFTLAAAQGDPEAQYVLGVCNSGKGCPENLPAALSYLRKSAEQGFGPAAWGLGVMLSQGTGAPRDPAGAVKWLRIAAAKPGFQHPQADIALAQLYRAGQGLEPGFLQRAGRLPTAADHETTQEVTNYIIADYVLGAAYMHDTPPNWQKAVQWLQLAAVQNNSAAQLELGNMYHSVGVTINYVRSLMWLKLAANGKDLTKSQMQNAVRSRLYATEMITTEQVQQADRLVAQFAQLTPAERLGQETAAANAPASAAIGPTRSSPTAGIDRYNQGIAEAPVVSDYEQMARDRPNASRAEIESVLANRERFLANKEAMNAPGRNLTDLAKLDYDPSGALRYTWASPIRLMQLNMTLLQEVNIAGKSHHQIIGVRRDGSEVLLADLYGDTVNREPIKYTPESPLEPIIAVKIYTLISFHEVGFKDVHFYGEQIPR